jgi:hypothetical protein
LNFKNFIYFLSIFQKKYLKLFLNFYKCFKLLKKFTALHKQHRDSTNNNDNHQKVVGQGVGRRRRTTKKSGSLVQSFISPFFSKSNAASHLKYIHDEINSDMLMSHLNGPRRSEPLISRGSNAGVVDVIDEDEVTIQRLNIINAFKYRNKNQNGYIYISI